MASGGRKAEYADSAPQGSPRYLAEAFKDLGMVEYITRNRKRLPNPTVAAMGLPVLGYKVNSITVPWCAIWIGAKLEADGYTCTKSAMARSYLGWGKQVDHGDDSKWKVGDIVVIWRGRKNDGVTGHVFFLLDWDDDTVTGIGGNQGDAVTVQEFARTKIIGMRRPRTALSSKTMQGAITSVVSKSSEVVMAHALPEPSDVEKIVDTARGPIEMMGAAKPWIVGILGAISVAAALYAAWYRMRDFNSGRNA